LSELRVIHAHIGAAGVDTRKLEFEFELEFRVVNAHFERNSARKSLSERHWYTHFVFRRETGSFPAPSVRSMGLGRP